MGILGLRLFGKITDDRIDRVDPKQIHPGRPADVPHPKKPAKIPQGVEGHGMSGRKPERYRGSHRASG
jgi:hypothetical protein